MTIKKVLTGSMPNVWKNRKLKSRIF